MLVQSQRESPDVAGQLAEDLEIIEEEIRRMERSIQTFLDFARPREPERRAVDPADVVRRVFSLIEPRAKNQRVDLKLIESESPLTIVADGEQLFQVVLNLCGNALDVMPSGGSLDVRVERSDGPVRGGPVRIVVQDSGPGIDSAIQPKLFQPFVTNKEAGVGLGLVICQRIARAHHGRLWGESLASGACFTLELPGEP
jgi:signal transduction histidine kinase